jgi:hypothetical protein
MSTDTALTINQILMNTLTPEHAMDPQILRFLNNYIENWNTSDSAKVANLKTEQGKRILRKPDVQAAITRINETFGRRANYDAREILERVNEVAQFDPAECFNADGTVKDIKEMSGPARRAIKKLVVKEVWENDMNGVPMMTGFIKTIEFWDKMKGLELLGKDEGRFVDQSKVTHEIGGNLAAVLLSSERRALTRDVTPVKLSGDAYIDNIGKQAAQLVGDDGD